MNQPDIGECPINPGEIRNNALTSPGSRWFLCMIQSSLLPLRSVDRICFWFAQRFMPYVRHIGFENKERVS